MLAALQTVFPLERVSFSPAGVSSRCSGKASLLLSGVRVIIVLQKAVLYPTPVTGLMQFWRETLEKTERYQLCAFIGIGSGEVVSISSVLY